MLTGDVTRIHNSWGGLRKRSHLSSKKISNFYVLAYVRTIFNLFIFAFANSEIVDNFILFVFNLVFSLPFLPLRRVILSTVFCGIATKKKRNSFKIINSIVNQIFDIAINIGLFEPK